MIEIKSYNEVLAQEQIDFITESVKDAIIEKDSFVEESHIEIRFGQFINGLCLIYVNTDSSSDNKMKGIASFFGGNTESGDKQMLPLSLIEANKSGILDSIQNIVTQKEPVFDLLKKELSDTIFHLEANDFVNPEADMKSG